MKTTQTKMKAKTAAGDGQVQTTSVSKESRRRMRYQQAQRSKGFCGSHPGRPLAATSTTVCQECLDRKRDTRPDGGHPTLWDKVKLGERTQLSRRDIASIRALLNWAGLNIDDLPDAVTIYDISSHAPKEFPEV